MKKHSPLKWIGITIAVVVGLVGIVVLRGVPPLMTTIRASRTAEGYLAATQAVWRADGYRGATRIVSELQNARHELQRAQGGMESLAFLDVLPPVATAITVGQHATEGALLWVDGASELAGAVASATELLDRFAERAPGDLSEMERAEILRVVGDGLSRARHAFDSFERGDAILASLSCPRWLVSWTAACRAPSFARNHEALTSLRASARETLRGVDRIATLVGTQRPTSVLLLFLNNTELRPGGGFLGTYGLATIHHGELTSFATDDVYNLDKTVEGTLHVPPPEPFRQHHIVPWWYLRDANWSPDFAESSSTVLDFYRREGGVGDPTVVIGFTPTLAAALLRVIGPVEINGTRFTAENIADELDYQVEKGYDEQGIPRPQRKAIITALSRAVIDRLMHRRFRDWGPIVTAVRTAIAERHLLASSSDAELQALFDRLAVTGRVRPLEVGEDGLLVVDANLGSLKSDPVVERSIRYAMIPDTSGYRGTVLIRYRNTGTFTWKTTRYRTYTRVYLPPGTTLIRSSGSMARERSNEPGIVDQGEELGRKWFGAFVSVEPGEERSLALEVRLAPSVTARIQHGSYVLRAQKQLGSVGTPLTLDLEFGTPVRVADPPEPPAAWGNSRYSMETDLRVDREFRVELQR